LYKTKKKGSKDKTSEAMKRSEAAKVCNVARLQGCKAAGVTNQKAKKIQ